jgi:uroporphyrinogen III methyltransferase/synthase
LNSLRGKTILLTRSDEANAEVANRLKSCGADTLSLPTIRFTDPDSWSACDAAIQELRNYDAILFTSSNAVRAFLARIEAVDATRLEMLRTIRVHAVGERTHDSLESAGVTAILAEGGTAEDLAESVGEHVQGKRFLFPKCNIAREVLPDALKARGAAVDEAVVYKTVAPAPRDLDAVRNALRLRSIDILVFFSPSAVSNFVQMIGTGFTESLVVAVIGPTTAEAARNAGFAVSVVSDKPTTEGLIDAIDRFLTLSPSVTQ